MNDNMELVTGFEERVHEDLTKFLTRKGAMDEVAPQCPDVEGRWGDIARSYIPDGAREFRQYPVVSLGWIMLVGMAMAHYWDTEWDTYSTRADVYESLRDIRGYDNLDEAVVEDVLGYSGDEAERVTGLVAECASRVYSLLNHERIEPGTEAAFGCYIAALHHLYLAGMAIQLNALGYHMTPLNLN